MLLCDEDADIRASASAELRALGDEAVPALIRAFTWIGAAEKPSLTRTGGIACDDLRLTVNLMDCLRGMRADDVVSRLVAALDDDSNTVRHHAGNTLAYIGEDSVPALVELLGESRHERVRTSAAWVLSLIGPAASDAIGPLTAALDDESKDVRYTARYALAQLEQVDDVYWQRIEQARNNPGN